MARKFVPSQKLSVKQKKRAMQLLHKKWKAHDGQKKVLRAIYADGIKRIFIRGARKFGKNELGNYLCWRTCIKTDLAETYVIGPTAEDEAKIIWKNERLPDFGPYFNQKVDNTNYMLQFPWGSFTQIDGCRNVKAAQGRTYDLIIYDEGKDQKSDYYDDAYPNLLAKDGILLFMGMPPALDEESGNFYRAVEEEAKTSRRWRHFHFTSWDNPHVSREWLEEEKGAYFRRGDEAKWMQMYEAEDVYLSAGAIFPMFDPFQHCRPIEVMLAEIKRGMAARAMSFYALSDPSQKVFPVLFIAYNRETSQIYILDEIYETDRYKTSSVPMWTAITEKKMKYNEFIPYEAWDDLYDEAASWFEVEVFNKFDHKIRPTNKNASKDKLVHVSLLKDAMTVPRAFQVANHCEKTTLKIKSFKDAHAKDGDDIVDLLRYFIEECGYTYQNVRDRIVINKNQLRGVPRGFSLENDERDWDKEENPFDHLLDFEFDIEEYGDFYGY